MTVSSQQFDGIGSHGYVGGCEVGEGRGRGGVERMGNDGKNRGVQRRRLAAAEQQY